MAIITGSTGNDRLGLIGTKNGVDDTIDGSTGLDSVSYDGSYADYLLKYNNGKFTIEDKVTPVNIANDIGTDTLVNIEKILFLGDQTQVSLSTEAIANAETSGDQLNTTVLKLSDGGFINFWYGKVMVTEKVVDATTGTESEVTHETLGYYFRQFDANGVALGLDKKIIADTNGTMSGFKPAIMQDGRIAIAWSEPDADKNGISVQIFNEDGTANSVKFRANDTLTDDQLQPSIAVLTDGSFVVAWTSANQGDSIYNDGNQMGSPSNQAGVFAQHFDSSGNPLGWEMQVGLSAGSDASISALNNGGYVIAHEAKLANTKKMSIDAYFYDANDQFQAAAFDINTTNEDERSETPDPDFNELAGREKLPQIATLTGGNVVIVWQAPRDAYPTNKPHDAHDSSIIAKIFDQDGGTLTAEFVVNTFWHYDQMKPSIAALKDGGFVVVWQSMKQDGSYWGVYGQRFDAVGNPVGDEFQVNTKVSDSQQNASVIGLKDGGFVVSWEAQYQDGNQQGSFQSGTTGTEIVQQRYDADGNSLGMSVAGGNNDDTITITGTDNIEISGGLGKDTLTSGDGNDTLRGGDGNDTLDAGNGNNVIIGGDGADTLVLAGIFANYDISGSNGRYLIVGKQGTDYSGIHDYVSSVEIVKFSDGFLYNLDSGQGGGTAGVTQEDLVVDGTAPGQPKTLEGTSGEDTLTGGNIKGAADTLIGGDGNDTYIAAKNGDLKPGAGILMTIFDTGGVDTLQIASNIDLSLPEKNTKTKGLNYIENVKLLGKANLTLIGSSGNNELTGNDGANKISGGLGNDVINGGQGKDKLTGGAGVDRFVFDTAPGKNNIDTIMDFNNDIIRLNSSTFAGLDDNGDGKLDNDAHFVSAAGKKAADIDSESFLIYDTNTGNLYYDAAGAASVQIAKIGIYDLDAKGNLTNVFHPAALTTSMFEFV